MAMSRSSNWQRRRTLPEQILPDMQSNLASACYRSGAIPLIAKRVVSTFVAHRRLFAVAGKHPNGIVES